MGKTKLTNGDVGSFLVLVANGRATRRSIEEEFRVSSRHALEVFRRRLEEDGYSLECEKSVAGPGSYGIYRVYRGERLLTPEETSSLSRGYH